jgi:hypothetical protein
VLAVDQYGGRSFDDYATAVAYQEEVGFPALMQAALDATADLPDGFVVAGFSNGAGMAEHVALHRPVAAAVLFSGALPLPFLGAGAWPAAVPVQLHYAVSDPNRNQDWVDQFLAAVRASGAGAEFHEYVGAGHLFTDASRPDEFDPAPRRRCGPTCTSSSGTSHERPTSVCRAEPPVIRARHGQGDSLSHPGGTPGSPPQAGLGCRGGTGFRGRSGARSPGGRTR